MIILLQQFFSLKNIILLFLIFKIFVSQNLNRELLIGLNSFSRKIFMIIFIILTFNLKLHSETPIIELDPFPVGYELELYEDNDDLYAKKLIEYYKLSVAYQTQLNLIGDTNKINIITPSIEELTDNDSKILKKYYLQAKKLKSKINDLPMSAKNNQINAMIEELNLTNKYADSLKIYADSYSMLKSRLDNNIKLIEDLANKLNELTIDYQESKISNLFDYYKTNKLIAENNEAKESLKSNVITINMGASYPNVTGDNYSNELSTNVGASINAGYLFNLDDLLSIDANYYNFQHNYNVTNNNIIIQTLEFDNQFYDLGLSFNFNDLFRIQSMSVGTKIGIAQYWGKIKAVNTNVLENDISGQNISLEINTKNTSFSLPIELYVNMKWFFMQDDYKAQINSNNTNLFNFGNNSFNSLQVGIRIPLWRTSTNIETFK